MEKIDYDTPQCQPNRRNAEKKDSFLTRLVFRTGLAKDKKQANIVLLFFAIILILLTVFYIIPSSKGMKFDSAEYPEDYMDFENLQ